MAIIYARLIELGILIIAGGSIIAIQRIKDNIKFKKSEKEWLENSFEWQGSRYHKKYFRVENGKITHNL